MLGGEGLKTVWIEALPVVAVVEEDDRDGFIPELPNDLSRFLVSRDIPIHELHLQVIQNFLRESTGIAGRGREDSDH